MLLAYVSTLCGNTVPEISHLTTCLFSLILLWITFRLPYPPARHSLLFILVQFVRSVSYCMLLHRLQT